MGKCPGYGLGENYDEGAVEGIVWQVIMFGVGEQFFVKEAYQLRLLYFSFITGWGLGLVKGAKFCLKVQQWYTVQVYILSLAKIQSIDTDYIFRQDAASPRGADCVGRRCGRHKS